jgi:endonuclease/exonuclease/phosphatase family metal-dependent hydrolase
VLTIGICAYTASLAAYLLLRLLFGDRFWWLAIINNFAFWTFLPLVVILPVTLILRQRWLIVVVAIPTVVALLWIGPYYLPKAIAASSGPTLRIVTFNVYQKNNRTTDVEAWLRTQQADIVFLEEIPFRYGRGMITPLKDIYPYQVHQDWNLRHWGNMILSRYPIISSENLNMDDSGLVPQLRAYLSVNGQTIAAYSVHLPEPIGQVQRIRLPFVKGVPSPLLRYDDSARNGEIDTLLTTLKAEKVPYIVAGDFNTSDQGATYSTLASQLGDTYREAGIGLGGSWPAAGQASWSRFMPTLMRIDYIWHSSAFRATEAQVGPGLGSDHLPVVATLELQQDR